MRCGLACALTLTVLTGCGHLQPISPGLESKEGITLSDSDSMDRYLERVELSRPVAPNDAEALPFCVAQTVATDEATLVDSSGSFVGAFTGTYYERTNVRKAGSIDGLRFASSDGNELVVEGTAGYTTGEIIPLQYSVRYTLAIEGQAESTAYVFTDIQQAQLNTGVLANTGYDPVGAWKGAHPSEVHSALSAVADRVSDCVAARND